MDKELFEVVATIASKSRPGRKYEIKRYVKSGTLFCPCEGWKYQRVPVEHRVCRHINEALKEEKKRQELSAVRQSFEGGWRN